MPRLEIEPSWSIINLWVSLVQMVRSCNNLFYLLLLLLLLFVLFFVHHREGYPCSVWREHEIWRSVFVCCRRRPEDRWPYMHVPCMWEVSGLMAKFQRNMPTTEWMTQILALSVLLESGIKLEIFAMLFQEMPTPVLQELWMFHITLAQILERYVKPGPH